MQVWKKFSAIALALVMSLALCAPAFAEGEADGDLTTDGIVGNFTTPDTPEPAKLTDAVIMYKEITAYNPETSTVNAPTITYNYTIAAGNAGKDIYDAKNNHLIDENTNVSAHVQTKAGVGTPTIAASLDGTTWQTANGNLVLTPSVQLTANNSGKDNKFKLKVNFDGISFIDADTTANASGAGVYRYVITETVTAPTTGANDTDKKAAAGIKDGDISNTRYLDVYVNGDGEIYGWVCFAYDSNIDERTAEDGLVSNDAVANAYKTEGFVAGTDSKTNSQVTADAYYTFNFEVTKTVEKDQYSITNHHKFPFTITLTNSSVTANVLPIMTFTDDITATTPNYGTSASYVEQTALSSAAIAGTWSPKIAHQAAVKYVGIPCGTTVTIKEQNDVSSVSYSAESANADTNAAIKSIFTNDYSNDAIINTAATALQAATKNYTDSARRADSTATGIGAITFTNTLLEISPTGVALRYAPYLAMMGAGIVALPLSLRKKEEEI